MTDEKPKDEDIPSQDDQDTRTDDETPISPPDTKRRNTFADYKARFKTVFGSGFGKLALICSGVAIIVLLGAGIRGLSGGNDQENRSKPSIQPVKPPKQNSVTAPVTESEAQRHEELMAQEALKAERQDKSYQSRFVPNVVPDPERLKVDSSDSFDVALDKIEKDYQSRQEKVSRSGNPYGFHHTPTHPSEYTPPPREESVKHIRGDDARQASTPPPANARTSSDTRSSASAQRLAQDERQANQKFEQSLKRAQADRDKFVANVRKQALNEAMALISGTGSGRGGVNALGSYSSISYYPEETDTSQTAHHAGSNGLDSSEFNEHEGHRKTLIKTGNMLYATLDSEVNTDDGNLVFATIRGGTWDGAKILGKVEQGNENIRLHFTTLAPQDERPTMKIDAVALREEDAKQGMAEEINHHILSRYSALAVSSLLAGYGRAYEQGAGRTIYSGNNVITQREKPTEREVYGSAVGEMGQAMASEIRRGFNRPSTYSTPANQGFGLYFLADMVEGDANGD